MWIKSLFLRMSGGRVTRSPLATRLGWLGAGRLETSKEVKNPLGSVKTIDLFLRCLLGSREWESASKIFLLLLSRYSKKRRRSILSHYERDVVTLHSKSLLLLSEANDEYSKLEDHSKIVNQQNLRCERLHRELEVGSFDGNYFIFAGDGILKIRLFSCFIKSDY